MVHKVVHYKVWPDQLDQILAAIVEFVDGISRAEPYTRYEAYQAEDGVSFVHFMTFPDQAAEKVHQTAPHTQRFVELLYPNCEQLPVFTDLTGIRSTGSD